MNLHNRFDYDPEAYLLFLIISRANEFETDGRLNMIGYLQSYGKEVQATCRVLEWLSLAMYDKGSPIGFSASHELMEVLAKPTRGRLTSAKEGPTTDDEDVIASIFEAAVPDLKGYDLGSARLFGRSVLGAIGLLRTTQNGDYAPTRYLRELAAERRQQDRSSAKGEKEFTTLDASSVGV
jgi:hypothetical protein